MKAHVSKLRIMGKERFKKEVCPNCNEVCNQEDIDIENCFEADITLADT